MSQKIKLKKKTLEEMVEQMIFDAALLKVQFERMERHVHVVTLGYTTKPVILKEEEE